MISEFSKSMIREMQAADVIEGLMQDYKLSRSEATKLWYESKTRKELMLSGIDYTFVSPARCYWEMELELKNDPRWMMGSFE